MLKDYQGIPVTTNNTDILDSINFFIKELLRVGPDADKILAAADNNPNEIMPQLLAAIFYLYAQAGEFDNLIKTYLAQAKNLLRQSGEREKLYYAALRAWYRNDYHGAIKHFETITQLWPQDVFAIKVAEFMFYALGQGYTGKAYLKFTERMYSVNQHDPYFLAMHSFALELNGEYGLAEQEAQKAISLDSENVWAHHTIAHVYTKQGRLAKGINALTNYSECWQRHARPIQSHNYWHLALLHLEAMDIQAAWQVVKDHILLITPDMVLEQYDTISFLWRLEMAGHVVEQTIWQDVAKHVALHANDVYIPFLTAHYAYALQRANQTDVIQAMQAKVAESMAQTPVQQRAIWEKAGLPLIAASLAQAKGDHKRVVELLTPIMQCVGSVGGSDAQTDLFRYAYVHSLAQTKQQVAAQNYLQTMLKLYPATPLQNALLRI